MMSDEHDEIASALRAARRSHPPPAGLEQRILAALGPQSSSTPRKVRFPAARMLLPAAAALALLALLGSMLRNKYHESAAQALPAAAPEITANHPEIPALAPPAASLNPLEAEAAALARDAERAGRFLMAHLPSLSLPQEPDP
jgi:hypothetical protein